MHFHVFVSMYSKLTDFFFRNFIFFYSHRDLKLSRKQENVKFKYFSRSMDSFQGLFKTAHHFQVIFKPVRNRTFFCPIPSIGLSDPCTFPASALWDLTLKRTPTRLKWSRDVQTTGPSMIMPEQMSHHSCTSWTGRQLKRDELWAVSVFWWAEVLWLSQATDHVKHGQFTKTHFS